MLQGRGFQLRGRDAVVHDFMIVGASQTHAESLHLKNHSG